MADRVNILFPVEAINRELDYRLFLSGLVARETNRIFVGQHDVIYRLMKAMRGGVYVGKHIFRAMFTYPGDTLARYRILKQNGLTLVHLHEEGGVLPGKTERDWEQALLAQLDPQVLAEDDYLCTWGEFQEKVYRSRSPSCSAIRTTGHPRFDLYKPPYRSYFHEDAKRLRDTYGDFILFNTNFVAAQSKFGVADWFSPRHGRDLDSVEGRTKSIAIWASDSRKLSHAVALCNRLSVEFPDRMVVIRPHPSEDATAYRAIFGDVTNVAVVNEGPVSPWLLACGAMIHSGCTTGIEGVLGGAQVFNYRPNVDDEADPFVASLFGTPCDTADDVIEGLDRTLRARSATSVGIADARVKPLIENLRSEGFPRLVAVVREAEERQRRAPARLPSGLSIRARERSGRLVAGTKGLVRPLFPARAAQYQTFRSYFPGFDRPAIAHKLRKVEEILDTRLKVTFYSDGLFSLESDS